MNRLLSETLEQTPLLTRKASGATTKAVEDTSIETWADNIPDDNAPVTKKRF